MKLRLQELHLYRCLPFARPFFTLVDRHEGQITLLSLTFGIDAYLSNNENLVYTNPNDGAPVLPMDHERGRI